MSTFTRYLAPILALCTVAGILTGCGEQDRSPLRIASADRPDLRVAAAIYAAAFTRAGIPATLDGSGPASDARLLSAVAAGELDLYPAYTGRLLSELTPSATADGGEELAAEISRSLPQGVAIGDPTEASDRPQLLIAASVREDYQVDTVALCGRLPAGLPLVTAADLPAAVEEAFAPCRPGPVERVDDPHTLLQRVATGRALGILPALQIAAIGDLGQVRTIPADGPPRAQNLVPVYRSAALDRAALKQLSRVAGELTTADLAELADRVAAGEDPGAVAAGWLSSRN